MRCVLSECFPVFCCCYHLSNIVELNSAAKEEAHILLLQLLMLRTENMPFDMIDTYMLTPKIELLKDTLCMYLPKE